MKRLLPTTWLLIAIALVVVVDWLAEGAYILPSPWNLLGLAPLAFGIWINLAADGLIRGAGTPVEPFEQPTALVHIGVYSHTRNPMYLGFVVILAGEALLDNGWIGAMVVPAFICLVQAAFIRAEERTLEHSCGSDWSDYKRRVRRWL
jgi:protein-S-isoprenylcysteine O-methyltransferase Ste14